MNDTSDKQDIQPEETDTNNAAQHGKDLELSILLPAYQ